MKERKKRQKMTRYGRILIITLSGVLAAMVFAATYLLRIPTGIGYANAGDAVILLCAYLLGPLAFFPAVIGSVLADLLAGYPIYMPATFLIKGAMGVIAGLIFMRKAPLFLRAIIAFLLAEGLMIAGYFLYEIALFGLPAAIAAVLPNVGQAVVSIVLAAILLPLIHVLKPRIASRLYDDAPMER